MGGSVFVLFLKQHSHLVLHCVQRFLIPIVLCLTQVLKKSQHPSWSRFLVNSLRSITSVSSRDHFRASLYISTACEWNFMFWWCQRLSLIMMNLGAEC